MNEEQSLWLLSKKYVDKPVRDTLLSMVGLENEIEKSRLDSFIRRINIQLLFPLCFFGLFLIFGLLLDLIYIIIKIDYTTDFIIVVNCLIIPLGLAGILFSLISYKRFSYKRFFIDDQLVSIKGKPYKIKCIYAFTYRTSPAHLDIREILAILLFFDIDGVKIKCLFPITPYRYLENKDSSIRKKVKILKEKILSKDTEIRYFEKSKLVYDSSIDYNLMIDKMKI